MELWLKIRGTGVYLGIVDVIEWPLDFQMVLNSIL